MSIYHIYKNTEVGLHLHLIQPNNFIYGVEEALHWGMGGGCSASNFQHLSLIRPLKKDIQLQDFGAIVYPLF